MSDENIAAEAGDAGFVAAPSVGSQLKAAREARQMSVGDIAMALKLTPRQVDALENGNWQGLPGQTFIRGFVRNYARLLQLDPAPLMGQLDTVLEAPQQRLSLPGEQQHVAMPQGGRNQRRDNAMVFSGLALVAVAVAIYFLLPAGMADLRGGWESVTALFHKEKPPAETPAPAQEPLFPPGSTPQEVMNPQAVVPPAGKGAPAPSEGLVPPSVRQSPEPVSPPAPASSTPAASASPTPAAPGAGAADAGASGTKAALRFAFTEESWVEVRDRQGKVLFSKVGKPGSESSVEGQGPFSLTVGNTSGVKLELRGQPVDLSPHTRGRVARLTLE